MAIDPAALNALTAEWAASKADLDDKENRQRINYNNSLDQLRRANKTNMGRVGVNMADRGLAQSGIRGQAEIKLQDEFNRANAQQAQAQALDLSTIARKRLEADALYNSQRVLM